MNLGNAYAATLHCNNLVISDVWVEGDRDDNFAFQNKLVIRIKDENGVYTQCGSKSYMHLENTSPAYSGMLSAALTAQTAKKRVEIAINTNNPTSLSNQLAFIRVYED
ncbi:hypothetical protein EYS14_21570 [Alteromonadaceae bacterium M269]|nr:hypothetical protein EYS14_21570 [Alteromonadaceae bacterium M269]